MIGNVASVTGLGDLAVLVLVVAAAASAVASAVAIFPVGFALARGRWMADGAAAAAAAVMAVSVLAWALLRSDFTVAYVVEQSRTEGSTWYRLAGLWGGMAGSLLVWTLMLAGVGCAAVWALRGRPVRLAAAAQAVVAGVVAGFGVVVVTLADPFVALAAPAVDGQGLTPILEHPAMLYHPPLLYLGLAGLLAPFALTVAAAAGRSAGRRLARPVPPPALGSWVLLGIGIVAGAHWGYVEVGWGGVLGVGPGGEALALCRGWR